MRALIGFFFGLSAAAAMAQVVTSPTGLGMTAGKGAVASMPSCSAQLEGAMWAATDALTPVALASVTGGGAIHVLVYCNGTAWVVG